MPYCRNVDPAYAYRLFPRKTSTPPCHSKRKARGVTASLLGIGHERCTGLEVYLDDPDVAIDTNHLEQALRVIPIGRRKWLFAWTELGAKHIGMFQSLPATCRLHDVDPSDNFVDALQRIEQHPASMEHQLTPRLWKELYAANPLRSDLHSL